jgi:tetratricopeptide (TPR) repeat protein
MRRLPLFSLTLLLLAATPAFAQGEVGEVAFANSGAPAAQAPFLRGLALLHNFEYEDAAEQFRAAQKIDPGFAMAYWGEAMTFTHPVWFQQELEPARAVLARLGATPEARLAKAKTEREKDYLRALDVLYGTGTKEERDVLYSQAMAALHERYPDDVDATAFYALSLLGTAHHGRDFALYMRSAALLEEVLPTHLHHPGVLHYLIHSYDDPIHAPLGLRAARLYGKVAPNAGHALHMTSHIFVALGLWDDVIAANQQAMEVVNRQRAEHGQPPRNCGHYVIWLHYAFLQERRFDEAKRQLDACRQAVQTELAKAQPAAQGEHPADHRPDAPMVGDFVQMRLHQAIATGSWEGGDLLVLPAAPFVEPRFTLAYGEALAASRGDLAAFRAAVVRLRERQREWLAEIEKAKATNPSDRQRAEIARQQVEALLRLREGAKEEGIALLEKAAAAETEMAFEFGPPAVQKPTYELLGDELAALGRHAEAEQAYRSALARAPGRTPSLQGLLRAQQALGDSPGAARTREQVERYVRTGG